MKKTNNINTRIESRTTLAGSYIAETGATIRTTAEVVGCSKSTVHNDINKRLMFLNKRLYNKVRKQLAKNLAERAMRSGQATKQKFEEQKKGI